MALKKKTKRTYILPKPKESHEAKMRGEIKKLIKRKLVSSTAAPWTIKLTKKWRGKKYTVRATKKGWLRADTSERFTSLYGVACSITGRPRSGYLFFREAFAKGESDGER